MKINFSQKIAKKGVLIYGWHCSIIAYLVLNNPNKKQKCLNWLISLKYSSSKLCEIVFNQITISFYNIKL